MSICHVCVDDSNGRNSNISMDIYQKIRGGRPLADGPPSCIQRVYDGPLSTLTQGVSNEDYSYHCWIIATQVT